MFVSNLVYGKLDCLGLQFCGLPFLDFLGGAFSVISRAQKLFWVYLKSGAMVLRMHVLHLRSILYSLYCRGRRAKLSQIPLLL